ncbi:MAG: hypothetical protein AB8B88_04150 [Devosiaceae bacterium]
MTTRYSTFLGTWKVAALSATFAFGAALSPIMVQAQEAPGFAEVDQNVDGVISEDEFLAAMPEATSETFASADVNGDTVLTQDEYEAMAAMMQ